MGTEERLASLEKEWAYARGVIEQLDRRLTRLENEITNLREEMNRRFDEINRRIDTQFRWVVVLILGMWTSIMCTLIPILLKLLGVI